MGFRSYIPITILFMVILSPCTSFSQENQDLVLSENSEKLYGPDADLVNGEKYIYSFFNAEGNPFFMSEAFNHTTIRINDRLFYGQRIRYDIYNHNVVLDFVDLFGVENSVVLRNEFLDYFETADSHFKKIIRDEGIIQFGQIIYEGSVSSVYFWKKEYLLSSNSNGDTYYFSEPQRETTLIFNNEIFRYKNNRSFVRIFEKDGQALIKQYLKNNRLKVKRANEKEMQLLMEYINSVQDDED